MDDFSHGPPDAVEKLNALVRAIKGGLIVESEDFLPETQPDGRVLLRLRANLSKPVPPQGPDDCADCDGVTVWSDSGGAGTCDYADTTIDLPHCAVSWTYHFAPNSSADRFTVNGVEYSGCTPLFGTPLPNADGTVAVSVSGRSLHIVVECSCATPPARNSTWSGYIICNIA